ncbi:hypothetical protein L3V82_04955 [Thiotrichales bacterium 19S3-7]|nr:hypothetical protein [Thiotrichales bacterium 19S3-7]MCF6801441.1 hypothetical protein [Thiotrichales bacterium 19S3-11]
MTINRITYRSLGGSRDIIVVNGYAFYKSTGKNSKMEGTWFPFLGINTGGFKNGWFMKPQDVKTLLNEKIQTPSYFSDVSKVKGLSRFGNLETAYLSYCLGGDEWEKANKGDNSIYGKFIKYFDDNDVELEQLLEVNSEPDFITDNDGVVNEWLKQQNCIYCTNDMMNMAQIEFPSGLDIPYYDLEGVTQSQYQGSEPFIIKQNQDHLLRLMDKTIEANGVFNTKFKAIEVLRMQTKDQDITLEDLKNILLQFERLVSHKRIGFRSIGSEANSYSSIKNEIKSIRKNIGLSYDQASIDQSIKGKQPENGVFTFSEYVQEHQYQIASLEF